MKAGPGHIHGGSQCFHIIVRIRKILTYPSDELRHQLFIGTCHGISLRGAGTISNLINESLVRTMRFTLTG